MQQEEIIAAVAVAGYALAKQTMPSSVKVGDRSFTSSGSFSQEKFDFYLNGQKVEVTQLGADGRYRVELNSTNIATLTMNSSTGRADFQNGGLHDSSNINFSNGRFSIANFTVEVS